MNAVKIISIIFVLIISAIAFFISYLQFNERGFLFNNEYFYASKSERKNMDKKMHYRQSAIVFLVIGLAFSIIGVELILSTKWLYFVEIFLFLFLIIYAVVSSISIQRKSK